MKALRKYFSFLIFLSILILCQINSSGGQAKTFDSLRFEYKNADSAQNVESARQINEMATKYESKRKQKEILLGNFNDLKGDLQQMDDVLIFGIRL